MKKKLSALLVLLLAVVIFSPTTLHGASEIRVTVDGVAVDFGNRQPVIVDGRVLVPVRDWIPSDELFGVMMGLEGAVIGGPHLEVMLLRTRYIEHDGEYIRTLVNNIFFTIGSDSFLDFRNQIFTYVPAQIIDGQIMVPIRRIAQSLGYHVYWDGETNTVIISSTALGQPASADYIIIRGDIISTSLTELDINWGLTDEDIIPLQYMANLRQLRLSGNRISDLTPLAGLTNLERLFLCENPLSDISPLAGLATLTSLWITRSSASDISPLVGLYNLEELMLWGNGIGDISPLAGLTNLTDIHLGWNNISDLTPLEGLYNLRRLILIFNQISDISPLSSLVNLTELALGFNPIEDDPMADWSYVDHIEHVDRRP